MITSTQIGIGNQLTAQMSDVASLYYIAKKNNEKLVFFDELKDFRRGYQFYKVFKMNGVDLINSNSPIINIIKPFLNDHVSKSWEKEMKRIYNSRFKYYKDSFLYKMFSNNNGFAVIDNLKNGTHTDPSLLDLDKNTNYDIRNGYGIYQDYSEYINEIVNMFTFKDEIINLAYEKRKDLIETIKNENSVSVHFRRADYLIISSLNLDNEYYKKALSFFDRNSTYIVFSDEIEDVKKMNLFQDKKVYYVEGNEPAVDLYLMSLCKNNIIANSNFSFWASILNRNEQKKVVCPYNYVGFDSYLNGNYYPKEYIAIKE